MSELGFIFSSCFGSLDRLVVALHGAVERSEVDIGVLFLGIERDHLAVEVGRLFVLLPVGIDVRQQQERAGLVGRELDGLFCVEHRLVGLALSERKGGKASMHLRRAGVEPLRGPVFAQCAGQLAVLLQEIAQHEMVIGIGLGAAIRHPCLAGSAAACGRRRSAGCGQSNDRISIKIVFFMMYRSAGVRQSLPELRSRRLNC